MRTDDPTIRELACALAAGSTSPREVLEHCLAAIDRDNARLNALPTLADRDALRRAADEAGRRIARGEPVGVLEGLPYVAKDTHRTRGMRTTWGSPIHADHVPDHDDPVVARLRAAGALLLGKSNTPEFAAGSQTFNPVFGATRNPYDAARTVGGSSGGAACAVATRMTVVADGSDLASSLRNPASFCGVVGHRPSARADPELAAGANAFGTLAMVGPMGRCVDDARLVHRAILERTATRLPARDWAQRLEDERSRARRGMRAPTLAPRNLRVAWTIDGHGAFPVAAPVRAAIERALGSLQAAGVTLIERSCELGDAHECFQVLRGLQFVESYHDLLLTERARLKDTIVWNIEFGLSLDAARIARAVRTRSAIHARVQQLLADVDAWLLPTAQVLPFSHEITHPTSIDGKPLATYIDWLASCYAITLSGHPAISIPGGFARDDAPAGSPPLPVGLQLVARWGEDERLFDVAETIEALLAPQVDDASREAMAAARTRAG